jgi:hypothetical protein
MSLENMTIKEFKEVSNLLSGGSKEESPFIVGENYLIRTVTFTYSGKLKSKTNMFLVLESASWIADTGRYNECLKDQSKFNEVEPYKYDVIVACGAIVDATKIDTLITSVK